MSTQPVSSAAHWSRLVGIGIIGSLLVSVVFLAFLWPTKTSSVQNIPVSISGPATAVTALKTALGEKAPNTFDFVAADDRNAAVNQIKSRETYGAIVLATPPQSTEVLTANAASTAVSQLLSGAATQLQAQLTKEITAAGGNASAVKVTVSDIVPLSSDDPNGAGLAAASFPLAIGGVLVGVLISLLVVGALRRLVTLAVFGVAAGLLLPLIVQTWFGYLQGNYWLNALALGLVFFATSSFIVGCSALFGRIGLTVAAVFTILFANPLAAAATPWQFLATPWGAIGQALTPGAGNWLIRSLSYFPDASNAQQWWTLTGWAALGLLLLFASRFRNRNTAAPAGAPSHAPSSN